MGVTHGTLDRFERIEGGLLGLLVGDALGVPYEFHPPHQIPPWDQIDMVPPRGFDRTYDHIAPGTWSDDGAQALCLFSSLLDNGGVDVDDLGRRLVAWLQVGYMAVDSRVFDVGLQTGEALKRMHRGVPAAQAGLAGARNNGNGSLMRSLPVALLIQGDDAAVVEAAHQQSIVTHAHPRSQACCALYCLWARRELDGVPNAWTAAVEALRCIYPAGSPFRQELEDEIRPDEPPSGTGTGYVTDCLRSARLACQEASYEAIVRRAVALGNDTDTTACVAGGIAGIRHGTRGIPRHWLASLRGRDIVGSLLGQCRGIISG